MQLRRWLRLGVLFLFVYLLLALLAGILAAEGALHPARRLLTLKDEILASAMARNHDAELSEVAVSGRDRVTLSAWSIRPRNDSGSAVILLHGLSDNRLGMSGYAQLLLGHGFSVLMPDARAHGASGGQLATYGLLESDDILRWYDWLQQSQHPSCIFGLGESMGAAQLLQSLKTERHFCAVAAESSFSSFREIAYDRVGQFFHTGPWLGRTVLRPVLEIAFGYARWKYKINFEQLSPETVVAETKVPVLLIHGRDDHNISIRHSRRITAHNPSVVLWEVPDTDHCGTISTARQEFEYRLVRWFDGHSIGREPLSSSLLQSQCCR